MSAPAPQDLEHQVLDIIRHRRIWIWNIERDLAGAGGGSWCGVTWWNPLTWDEAICPLVQPQAPKADWDPWAHLAEEEQLSVIRQARALDLEEATARYDRIGRWGRRLAIASLLSILVRAILRGLS